MTSITGQHIRQYGPQHVAERLGISTKTLRRWEADGAIPTAWRTAGGHRRYSEHDVEVIRQHISKNQKVWN